MGNIRMEGKRDIAVRIGLVGGKAAEISLSFAVSRSAAGRVRIEVDVERRARCGVQSSFDRLGAASHQGLGNNREVLQIVRTTVGVLGVIRCYAVRAKIDSEVRSRGAIRVDGVAADGIGETSRRAHLDTVAAVKRDSVAVAGLSVADGIEDRAATRECDTISAITQCTEAVGRSADQVAQHKIAIAIRE